MPGTAMLFTIDDGEEEVAFRRMRTVIAEFPNELRVRLVELMDFQVLPLSTLYSIVFETPVIMFCAALNAAFGAAGRTGTVTLNTADANALFVAATRT